MRLADWRYAHLAYRADTDDACCDAASACVTKVLRAEPGRHASCVFKTPAGVVEAFADSVEVAPGAVIPRAAVLVWTHVEHQRVAELLERFQ